MNIIKLSAVDLEYKIRNSSGNVFIITDEIYEMCKHTINKTLNYFIMVTKNNIWDEKYDAFDKVFNSYEDMSEHFKGCFEDVFTV